MSAGQLAPGMEVAGQYRLDEKIGEGGFGTVYRATELKLDRQVALKALHPDALGKRDLEGRFVREAQLGKNLEHPNTVRLLDFGRAKDGTPFIVYELLKGQPLDVVVQAGPMPAARVARVGVQVLKSLMEAHQHGIVHRDIKPSNIFLCEFSGERDFVKVLDFGIAKADPREAVTVLTAHGFAVGTPSYMAPEQVRGKDVGAPTDLYALGLLLAEMLAGRVIMTGDTGPMIAVEQTSERPVPLPPEVLQSPLGPIILRATQKDASRRFQSAEEMLQKLTELELGAGANTRPSAPQMSALATAETGYVPTGGMEPPGGGTLPRAGTGAGVATAGAAPSGAMGYPPAPGGGTYPMGSGAASGGYASPPAMAAGGYASPPAMAAGGYANPPVLAVNPMAPPMAPPPPTKSGSGMLLALVAIGGLLAVVGGLVLVLVMRGDASTSRSNDDDARSAASDDDAGERVDDDSGNKKPESGRSPIVEAGPLTRMSLEELRRRIEAGGWQVTDSNEQAAATFSYANFTIKRPRGGGMVQIYKYGSTSMAKRVEEGARKADGAYVREDGTVILVICSEVDVPPKTASKALLDIITGATKPGATPPPQRHPQRHPQRPPQRHPHGRRVASLG